MPFYPGENVKISLQMSHCQLLVDIMPVLNILLLSNFQYVISFHFRTGSIVAYVCGYFYKKVGILKKMITFISQN